MELDPLEDAIAAIAAGEMVIVVDDEDRENEGDLIMAAEKATSEQVAFMIRHTSGILCTPIPSEAARRLRLDPMVAINDAPQETAFTVSVDFQHGLTTGISAEERANTIRAIANNNTGPADFVRPGHIFPLISKAGGVLVRSGHTEAAVDLAAFAGLQPAAVLAELVNDDGTVKRLPQIMAFAGAHGLKVVSIADLIQYRQRSESLVTRIAEFDVALAEGAARCCVYRTVLDDNLHYALCFGDLDTVEVLVRIHRASVLPDVFGARVEHHTDLARKAIGRLSAEGGVLVYLRDSGGYAGKPPWIDPSQAAEDGDGGAPPSSHDRRSQEWREVGLGAQILLDLGVTSIELLATSERHYVGLDGYGIHIRRTTILD